MEAVPKGHKRDLVVEVLRDDGGKLYSQIRDRNLVSERGKTERYHRAVVIDRQRGRHMDADTVQNRAESMSILTGFPLVVNLDWPCMANKGFDGCRCPECVKKIHARSR